MPVLGVASSFVCCHSCIVVAGVWRLALAGGLAGCCYWGAMFPTDVVKSRIQVRGELSGSFWITLAGILRSEGEFCS